MAATLGKLALSTLALPLVLLVSSAQAQDNPCRKFEFSGSIDCRIEVSGGCKVNCVPLQFEAYCQGGCTAEVAQTCTNDCSAICMEQCDPNHLDCVAGCHTECEQPCIDKCEVEHPGNDCVTDCKSSCNMHCDSACGVTVDSCLEHCRECCHGACDTQVNLGCDLNCFAELRGGCEAQCEAPTGALFCNGQYIYASDVDACIVYLAQQGVEVNVEARGAVQCDLSGCDGDGDVGGIDGLRSSAAGCSAAPGQGSPLAATGIAAAVLALGLSGLRRKSHRSSRK